MSDDMLAIMIMAKIAGIAVWSYIMILVADWRIRKFHRENNNGSI